MAMLYRLYHMSKSIFPNRLCDQVARELTAQDGQALPRRGD
jgi:hypothetical protein